jgi:hypothetical protein
MLENFIAQEKRRPRSSAPAKQEVSKSDKPTNQYRRGTYYFRPDQMHALKVRAAELRRDQSAIMRELLDNFLRETAERRP